ncbi:MAG: hypothetical protein KGI50_05925, partial [Patescibacteria group bacterium]|nr:hypothetical protein [Patescibacteria group bacterium]
MAIDPNIALGVQTTQLNPLQTATQAAQLGYLLTNSNKLQQEVNANKAISAAYQQATDPNTGVVDNNKLSAIISQNPDAAYNLGTVQQGINTQKQQQVALQSSQLQQAQTAQTNLRQGLGGLITKPDLSPQDIQGF